MPSTWCFLFFASIYTSHSVKTLVLSLKRKTHLSASFCFASLLLHTHILHYSYSIFFLPHTTTPYLPPSLAPK
jgi:hypothetical protein